jgi:hypothetical protein
VVDGVLVVALSKDDRAGLPPEAAAHQAARSGGIRRETDFLAELGRFLCVVARRQRERRVIEVGHILRLPPHDAGGRGQRESSPVLKVQGGAEEIPIGLALRSRVRQ